MKVAVCDTRGESGWLCSLIDIYLKEREIDFKLYEYSDCSNLVKNYEMGKYSVIFFYVEDRDCEELKTAYKIRKMFDINVIIILVSNSTECMKYGYDVMAEQFFLKPLKYDVFKKKMDYIMEYMLRRQDIMSFDSKGTRFIVNMSEVYVIESEKLKGSNRNIRVIFKDIEIHIKGVLKDILNKYNIYLIAINRYTLVNIREIYKIEKNELELKNGIKLIVSRRRMREVKEQIDHLIQ